MSTVAEPAVRIIEPRAPGLLAALREFWRYRGLTAYFGRQMLMKLYRRTWLGWLWIPLRPTVQVITSAFVFGGLLGVSSGDVPYPIFFLVTFAAWELFSFSLLWGTRSIEQGRRVLKKMYVPRLTCLSGALAPAGAVFLVYLVMAVLVLGGYALVDGRLFIDVGPQLPLALVGLALCLAVAFSVALFTSVYAARARDVRFGVGYLLGFWVFISPVIYPLSEVPDAYRPVTVLNPMTFPLELYRLGLFGQGELPPVSIASTLIVVVVVGGLGLRFFNRSEALALDGL